MDAPMYLPHRSKLTGLGSRASSRFTGTIYDDDNGTLVDSEEDDDQNNSVSSSNKYVLKPIIERRKPTSLYEAYMNMIAQSFRNATHLIDMFFIDPGRKCFKFLHSKAYEIAYQATPNALCHIIKGVKETVNSVNSKLYTIITRPIDKASCIIGAVTTKICGIGRVLANILKARCESVNILITSIKDAANRKINYIWIRWPWAIFYLSIITGSLLGVANDIVDYLLDYIPQPSKYYYRDALLAQLPIYNITRTRSVFRGASSRSLSRVLVLSDNETSPRLAFSFCGCSWLILYHAGVGMALQKKIRREVLDHADYLGASSGALIAAAMAIGIDLDKLVESLISLAKKQQQRFFGPISIMSKSTEEGIRQEIPDDDEIVHQKVNSRLTISLTHFPEFTNELKNEFNSRDSLIDCILASSFFPFYWEKPISMIPPPSSPEYVDVNTKQIYIDGGFTNNQPWLSKTTITISPHPGEANISPNLPFPIVWTLFPPFDESILREIVNRGYLDGSGWLDKKLEEGVLSSFLFK